MENYANPTIARAMQSVAAATARAEADPSRPIYHFRPPALWMNDPNGTIYHNGYYHLFYQHNPYGDDWGHMHWGHARSKDLVYWEHLPIALWPSEERGEGHCFSGCAWISGQGQPMLFYTKVSPGDHDKRLDNEQWAAIGDADWLVWQKHPANPILSLENHGGPKFGGEWRDPFIFQEGDRTFMVLAGNVEEKAMVALYEAEDTELVRWRYRGILAQKPTSEVRYFECPNFFSLGDRWILLYSPYAPVRYMTGSFDVETLSFSPEQEGVLDPGFGNDVPNFYATNILFDDQGRCILLGWVRGFTPGRGWNGCLALPRILSIGPDGRPRQEPVPELQRLRGRQMQLPELTLNNSRQLLADIQSNSLELQVVIEPDDAKTVGLTIGHSQAGQQGVAIRYDGQNLEVAGVPVPFKLSETEKALKLHLFLDRSVLEVFANDGRVCVTRVIDPPAQDSSIELFATGGRARFKSIEAWEMNSIW